MWCGVARNGCEWLQEDDVVSVCDEEMMKERRKRGTSIQSAW